MTSRQGAPRPVVEPSLVQRQSEAARLLLKLDEMLKATRLAGGLACHDVSVGGLNRYRRFAKNVRDFFALAAVVEEKLFAAPELAGSSLMTALDQLHARMLVLFVETSSSFFKLYVRMPELPIGAHEICGLELRGLMAISEFLDDSRYEGERGSALREEAERIAGMMRYVMERIPPLPDFGDLPSVGPKGERRRPLKIRRRTVDARAAQGPTGAASRPSAGRPSSPPPHAAPPSAGSSEPDATPFVPKPLDDEDS